MHVCSLEETIPMRHSYDLSNISLITTFLHLLEREWKCFFLWPKIFQSLRKRSAPHQTAIRIIPIPIVVSKAIVWKHAARFVVDVVKKLLHFAAQIGNRKKRSCAHSVSVARLPATPVAWGKIFYVRWHKYLWFDPGYISKWLIDLKIFGSACQKCISQWTTRAFYKRRRRRRLPKCGGLP